MASFYRQFVKDFSTIIAPLNELVEKNIALKWGKGQENVFYTLKEKLYTAPILCLHDFSKSFEIECDASRIDIGAILMQENQSWYISVRS